MIARIRRGNDFHVAWKIKRGGVAENLENVTDIKLERTIYGVTTEHTLFTVSGDTITAEIPAEVQTHNGQYKLTLSYELVDMGMSDDDRKCKVAIYAFAIVDPLGPADDLLTVDVASDVSIGFKGDKGLSAYQVWLENGNVGTEDDYFDYLRQPATDAAASISALEQTVSDNEALRVTAEQDRFDAELLRIGAESARNDAEGLRNANEIARIEAEGIRDANETDRINAEELRDGAELIRLQSEVGRNAAEGLRVNAETGRNTAEGLRATAETGRINAEGTRVTQESARQTNTATAISGANEAAEAADTARVNLTNAVNTKLDEADDKIEEMDTTLSTYDGRVTQVEADISQLAGDVNQMINDESARLEQESIDRTFKTMRIGASGLVTLSPTTRYFTYRLNVMDNITLTIDLQRMIQQVGNARCRLIIDMPILKTITITKPLLWGGTAPTFAAAGQYIFELIDVDGSNTPLIWQVASTTKIEPTGNILFVDSTGADYSVGQINSGTPTRATSSWASPFKYLQNAINAAQAGDIIFIKQGIYKPTHLRTTPTVYVDGDRLNRNATFTPKNGVDIYGGFVGTETKTWQRVMDANGYPINKTILCGDLLGEATVDPAKTVGDTRTDASKANAAYNVVFGKAISALTYLNGVNVRYGNASYANSDQSSGGGVYSAALFVGINNTTYSNTAATYGGGWYSGTNTNCVAYNNTATNGGGWYSGTNTNCVAYGNTAATYGGGWYSGTNTNCVAYNNTITSNGGGWYSGTNTNCTAYSNRASNGGGWLAGTNTNCTAYGNRVSTNGGGWHSGTNTNCTAYGNRASNGGGWFSGTNTNCTAYSNTADTGGGWRDGTNTNCTAVNNKAPEAVFGSPTTDTHINCLLYNNKTAAGVAVGFDNKTASGVKIFRNNAYDVAHPTITGGAGSDINTATCIANLTSEQAKIDVPTFIGAAETPEQLEELKAFAATITTKLKPKAGSVLKGAGVNNTTYPNPTDYDGKERQEASTIGILEGE